jgi:hypothetical protein
MRASSEARGGLALAVEAVLRNGKKAADMPVSRHKHRKRVAMSVMKNLLGARVQRVHPHAAERKYFILRHFYCVPQLKASFAFSGDAVLSQVYALHL